MFKTREYQALFLACNQEGCILCRLANASTARYLDTWKYELFTDVDIRKRLRTTQGFCHTHTWQLARMGAALPIAQAYQEIISDSIDSLTHTSPQPASGNLLQRLFDPSNRKTPREQQCPACQLHRSAEERYAHSLQQALTASEFTVQFAQSDGLCLPHFQFTTSQHFPDISDGWRTNLRQAQLQVLQRLNAQLQELIRKHDYRFKDEERGPEMRSWQRAAGFVAGENDQGNG